FRTAGGHRRIQRADLARFCKVRAIPFAPDEDEAGRVLVVDADAAVRDAIADVVRQVDDALAVEVAGAAFTAGPLVAEQHPAPLFMDERVAGADVLELTGRLVTGADGASPIRVAVLHASPSADAERAARGRGAIACLGKPPAAADIERVVRAAFDLPEPAQA